jgi:ubiquinol-cytochrome c reductase iron-sulfur subunit
MGDTLVASPWRRGTPLVDVEGQPIAADALDAGGFLTAFPAGADIDATGSPIVVVRVDPRQLRLPEARRAWAPDGLVAYSKICTHAGCPVGLYEQQTHHLLCPCHQSQFDITHEAEVIFGPAKRPLPQLPITVDSEGYLIARSDFTEPVGPSFWERS